MAGRPYNSIAGSPCGKRKKKVTEITTWLNRPSRCDRADQSPRGWVTTFLFQWPPQIIKQCMTMFLCHSAIRTRECEKGALKERWNHCTSFSWRCSTYLQPQRFALACCPYLHQVMFRHCVWYPADFVIGLEDVIMNLKFLSAIIPVKQSATAGLGGKQRSIQLSATICPAWIDKWDDNGGKHSGWGERGMPPQWSKRINAQLWERGFGVGLTWWRQVRLCWW